MENWLKSRKEGCGSKVLFSEEKNYPLFILVMMASQRGPGDLS